MTAFDLHTPDRASRLFRAIGFGLDRLGRSPRWRDDLEDVLAVYGQAIEVHRMCLCQIFPEADDKTRCELVHEWNAPGVAPRLGWTVTRTFVFEDVGLGRVSAALAAEVPLSIRTMEDFGEVDLIWLGGTKSFLYVPIFLDSKPWGFLGADDVREERAWTTFEIEGLLLAAKALARTVEMLAARDTERGTEERLRAVLEHIPAAVFWKDEALRYQGLSREMAEWLGFSDPSALVGKTDAELPLPKEETTFFTAVDRRVMARDRAERGLLEPLLRPDGELRYLRTTKVPLHDAKGRVVGVLGTSLDVTDAVVSAKLEARLPMAGSDIAVGIFDVDLRERMVVCSETFRELMGLPERAEIPMGAVFSAMHESEQVPLQEAIEASISSGTSLSREIRLPQGRWLDLRARPVTGPEGTVERLVGFVVETTHRRRDVERIKALNVKLSEAVEEKDSALEAKDALLEAIAAEVPGVLFQTLVRDDGSRDASFIGPGLEQLGLDARRPEDLEAAGLLPGAPRLQVLRERIDAGETPEWRFERILEHGGRRRWLRTVARPRRVDGEVRFSGVLLDVTAELEAAASLRASEAKLRAVSDALPVGLFLEEQGQLTYVNEAFGRLLGGRNSGEDVVRAVHPEDQAALRSALAAALAPPFRRTIEVRAPTVPGAPVRWLRVNAAAVRDEERILGVAGALEDVTSARRLAEETMSALVRSEELHRLKTRVLTTVSHEFRTPLTAIDMATQFLERHLGKLGSSEGVEPRAIRSVERIRRALGSLTELMEDILMYARVESGRLEVKREPIRVNDLIYSVVEQLQATTVRDRVDVSIGERLEQTVVSVDPRLLRTVLANLLSNALKYSREEVVVAGDLVADKLVLSVEDRGIGVVTGELESLTEPFFRGSNAREPGTGLGLAIVRSAAEAMGGCLVIESRSGQGTMAWVEVPLS